MATARRSSGPRIFFPWESRGGLVAALRARRTGPMLLVAGAIAALVLVVMAERKRSGVRQTRATVSGAREAIESYMAEHDGGCPGQLRDVVPFAAPAQSFDDAWGRPLRLRCPGRLEGAAYDLSSDGPDGIPGGLDRIE
jgi:general secretion pathway protein G